MSVGSPTIVRVNNFIYGEGEVEPLIDDEEFDLTDSDPSGTGQRNSMYVTLFEGKQILSTK